MATSQTEPRQPQAGEVGDKSLAITAAISSYGIWGLFPLLFHALAPVNPFLVVAHRVIWSFLLVGGILLGRRRMDEVGVALRDFKLIRRILFASMLLVGNWTILIWAVAQARVLEVSFGYFINPLLNVAIGILLLGERLNRTQWLALCVAVIAITIQAFALGSFPWVSVSLAGLFGFYGYVRKTINVGSAAGLFVETIVLLPFALIILAVSLITTGVGVHADPWFMMLFILTGPATSFSLLLFVYGARRLPYSMMGMFQYIAPSLHFMLAVWAFGEPLNTTQLVSFAIIWLSLGIYSYDAYLNRPAKGKAAHG